MNKRSKVISMAEKYTSVKIPQQLSQQIVSVFEEATGIKPNVTEFVRKAIADKIEYYRTISLSAEQEKKQKKAS